jgi:hypothetical protein
MVFETGPHAMPEVMIVNTTILGLSLMAARKRSTLESPSSLFAVWTM